MNLYKICFTHYGPKDSESGLAGLIIAENGQQVLDWILKEKHYAPDEADLNERTCWAADAPDVVALQARAEALKLDIVVDEDSEVYGTYRDLYLLLQDDPAALEDLYYGQTSWGWEDLGQLTKESLAQDLTDYGLILAKL